MGKMYLEWFKNTIYRAKSLCGKQFTKTSAELTIKADSANVAEQLFAVDAGHARAEARVSVAELPVHAVQGVGHGVHRVHHKLNLPLLFVTGITTDLF